MLCQDKMTIKTCAQCYIVYICISICQYFISVLHQYVDFCHSIVYRGKTFNYYCENYSSNTNYSQNTSLFMTYYPEPFHNKYKSDVRLLYGLLLKVHFGYNDVDFFKARDHCLKV